jgi:TonB family protein
MTLVEILTQRLPVWERNGQADPHVPDTLPQPILDIARQCLRRDLRRRPTVTDIANRLNPSPKVKRIDQSAPLNGSRPGGQRWMTASILFLALSSVIFLKVRGHSSNAGTTVSHGTGVPIGHTPAEPPPVRSVVASTSTKLTVSNKKSSVKVSPTAAQTRLPEASIAPAAGPAEAADTGITHQVLPNVPEKARATIRGTVRISIKVGVDDSGNITDAAIDSPGPSPYFANLALQAARQWKFAPARNRANDWTIRFKLSNSGTEASARNTTP